MAPPAHRPPRRPRPPNRRPDSRGRPSSGREGRDPGSARSVSGESAPSPSRKAWDPERGHGRPAGPRGGERHRESRPPEGAAGAAAGERGSRPYPERRPSRQTGPALPRRPGTTYLYGINPVQRALAVGKRKFYRLWLRDGRLSDTLTGLQAAAEARGLPVGTAAVDALTVHAGSDSHQGAVLECGPLPLGDEAEALALLDVPAAAPAPSGQAQSSGDAAPAGEAVSSGETVPSAERVPSGAAVPAAKAEPSGKAVPPRDWPLLVVLDQVEDPQNFGAIVRNCVAFGAAGVVVPRHHTAPPSPAASKASAGELEACPIFEAANLSRFLEACKTHGAWTVATVTEGGQALGTFTRGSALVLVVGNEGRGMRPLVERHCDFRLTVPVRPGTSLNVSAATAVVLYALMGNR